MLTKLKSPIYVQLPEKCIPNINSVGSDFFYKFIRLELRGTLLYMRIQTWKGVETCIDNGINLSEFVELLNESVTIPAHKIIMIKMAAVKVAA